MDAWPMIEACLRSGNGLGQFTDTFYGFYACPDCGHEASRQEHLYLFDCNWCEREAIQTVWRRPRKDGTIEYEETVNHLVFGVEYADA